MEAKSNYATKKAALTKQITSAVMTQNMEAVGSLVTQLAELREENEMRKMDRSGKTPPSSSLDEGEESTVAAETNCDKDETPLDPEERLLRIQKARIKQMRKYLRGRSDSFGDNEMTSAGGQTMQEKWDESMRKDGKDEMNREEDDRSGV